VSGGWNKPGKKKSLGKGSVKVFKGGTLRTGFRTHCDRWTTSTTEGKKGREYGVEPKQTGWVVVGMCVMDEKLARGGIPKEGGFRSGPQLPLGGKWQRMRG